MTASLPDEKAARTRELYDRISLGIVRSLEKRTGVTDVKLLDRKPADPARLLGWEEEHSCSLPHDFKNFYITTDGLLLCWSVKFNGSVTPLGRMEVNPLANLKKISIPQCSKHGATQSVTVDDTESDDEESKSRPTFADIEKAFEIDACCSHGKVCLVYKVGQEGQEGDPEIWFLDRAVRWHFLAASFMEYFRLMVMHLGLPQWQYAFTDIGLSPMSKQWFNLYAPVRMAIDDEQQLADTDADIVVSDKNLSIGKIDIDRLFKITNDRNRDKVVKKKPQAAPSTQTSNQKLASSRPSLAHLASKRNNR